jgi:hypothetical protein
MVFTVKPVKLLLKLPVPVPSEVLLLAVVGPETVFQHTPLAVTVEVPAEETLPPQVAVVCVMLLTSEVFTTGADKAGVVNVFSSPYEVPTELVAYART